MKRKTKGLSPPKVSEEYGRFKSLLHRLVSVPRKEVEEKMAEQRNANERAGAQRTMLSALFFAAVALTIALDPLPQRAQLANMLGQFRKMQALTTATKPLLVRLARAKVAQC